MDDDKAKIIAKYGLKLENGMWVQERENSHKSPVFRDVFFRQNDVLGLLFRINKLCGAKVKYFRENIGRFDPLKYDYRRGFCETALWDSEFLRHRLSGWILDYRFLQSITVHEDFVSLCRELEAHELSGKE